MSVIELEDVSVKEEALVGMCQTCLDEQNLRDMNSINYHNGKSETYQDMLAFCFSIKIGVDSKELSGDHYFICDECVVKLQDAVRFRSQIESSQFALKQLFDKTLVENDDNKDFYNLEDFCSEVMHSDFDESLVLVKEESVKINDITSKIQNKSKRSTVCKTVNKQNIDINNPSSSRLLRVEIESKKLTPKIPFKLNKSELKCRICEESFHVHKSLVMHMSLHFPNLICEQCGRTFATRVQLRNHQGTHVLDKKSCTLCTRQFKNNGSLRSHIRAHNGDYDRYRCPVCLDRFSTYSNRRKHMVQLHGEESKRYACKHCPKRFSLPTNLSAHVRNVHLRERTHICTICGTGFFLKRGLDTHMLSHTGERNYSCSICFKSYGRKYTLNEHMKIHNNERPHVCSVCGKAFTQKVTLKGHMQLHEKDDQQIVNTVDSN